MRKRKPPEEATAIDVEAAALRLLANREHSVAELRSKLSSRRYPPELLEGVLQALIDQNLLSDERFVEVFISSRSGRGDGPIKIRAGLMQRGIAKALMEQAFGAAKIDWKQQAGQARERRFGPDEPGEFPERARQARFLQQRGFNGEQIRAALNGDLEDC